MFAALHNHSHFSLLDGVVSPEGLAKQAARLDIPAIALTDHNAIYGAIPFAQACESVGINAIIGAEMTVANLTPSSQHHLTLLAMNRTGYANLCQLITLARAEQPKGTALLEARYLPQYAEGLICLSGCLDHGPVAQAVRARRFSEAQALTEQLRDWFGDRLYLEVQRLYRREDYRITKQLIDLAAHLKLKVVATPNAHYLHPTDAPLHDVLRCVRARIPLDKAGNDNLLRNNAEFYLRDFKEMQALYVDVPTALTNTLEVAERCEFDLLKTLGVHVLPKWDGDALAKLRTLCEAGLDTRYSTLRAKQAAQSQLEHELTLIAQMGLTDYFLMVWDVMHWAQSQGILCQGRGSAANSLVAYLLGITAIDPIAFGLVFERFLSPERSSPPDIDLDFASTRREDVIQYVYAKYGPERAAMVCTFNTYGARSAVRDVGFALGWPENTLDEIAKTLDQHRAADLDESMALKQVFTDKLTRPEWQQLFALCERLDGAPRHLGIHVGGMILTDAPLSQMVPIEPASMAGRSVIQWDKDQVESARLVKLDILSLRTLSAIQDALDQIEQVTEVRLDLHAVDQRDRRIYDMICRGETLGVFQIESRAQANVIPRMQPRTLADLTVQVALIRPGPIQGNMVNPYLRRRMGHERMGVAHPLLEPILRESLGVMVFQEQVIKIAREVAGFSGGQGELLRRALGSKHREEFLAGLRLRFIEGAMQNGVPEATAQTIFEQLSAFGSFSFAKSHAASFVLITYWHAWLRYYYPAAFFCGILRNMPMGFYPLASVMADAQRAGVTLLHPDINRSEVLPVLEVHRSDAANAERQNGVSVRIGLTSIAGIGEEVAQAILEARKAGPFVDLNDFITRTTLDRKIAEDLILAGALDDFGERRQLLWALVAAFERREDKRGQRFVLHISDEEANLEPFTPREKLQHEFQLLRGLINAHPTDFRAEQYAALKLTPSRMLAQLKDGTKVRVGGVNAVRQRPPTAKGVAFLAIEDKLGMMNIVVPKVVYERDRQATRAPFIVVEGHVQKADGVVNVVAERVGSVG